MSQQNPSASRFVAPARKSAQVLFTAFLLLCCAACTGRKLPNIEGPKPGKGTGLILVDSPEVFARERLVRDRELQKKWLKDQLNVSDEWFDAVQGTVQSRSLRSSSFSLGIDATPAAGLAIREADAQSESLAREQEIANLQHQIQLTQLQNDLERARSGEPASSMTITTLPTGSEGMGTAGATGDGTTSGSTDSGAAASGMTENGTAGGTSSSMAAGAQSSMANSQSLPGFAAAIASTIKDSPIDRFRDRLAYREIVRQELLENDLDDSHDLLGNTLYRLTFDTTIIPEGNETDAWANVEVQIIDKKCDPDSNTQSQRIKPLMRGFLDDLEGFLQSESRVFYEALLDENPRSFYDPETAKLAMSSDPMRSLKRIEEEEEGKSSRDIAGMAARLWADCKTIDRYLKHHDELKNLVSKRQPECPVKVSDAIEKAKKASENDEAWLVDGISLDPVEDDLLAGYYCNIINLLPDSRIEPYAITPKESVERLSDSSVARVDEERAITAGLAAGTVNLSSAIKFLNKIENQREAVRRLPLVVGYSERWEQGIAKARVGWMLGPRFHPRYRSPGFDFRHRPIQIPLSAVISVPSWWTFAQLQIVTSWGLPSSDSKVTTSTTTTSTTTTQATTSTAPATTSTATTTTSTATTTTSTATTPSTATPATTTTTTTTTSTKVAANLDPQPQLKLYSVELPGDPSGLLAGLFPRARRPRPYFYGQTPALEVGRKSRLVIYGENLWRNPLVFIGNQQADEVEILPDMKGIVATFSKVQEPAGWSLSQSFGLVDSWVWTSEGNSSIGLVRLHKPATPRPANLPKVLFKVASSSSQISADDNKKSAVSLEIKFDTKEIEDPNDKKKKIKKAIVDEIFLEFEKVVVDALATKTANPEPSCLAVSLGLWKVSQTCNIEVHFQSLTVGEVFTVKSYRLEGEKKVYHEPISIEVR